VALGTAGAEASLVYLGLGMAGDAALRRALEGVVGVAGFAINRSMLAGELEGGEIVVERGHVRRSTVRPVVLGVAVAALGSPGQLAVHRAVDGELLGDVGVAGQAA
jgi:hypothetical protein